MVNVPFFFVGTLSESSMDNVGSIMVEFYVKTCMAIFCVHNIMKRIEISNIRFNVYVLALRCIVFMCVDNGQMASREQYLSKKHMFANL